ncbi:MULTISPECIES: hypothetical protein [Vibrio harveyi group]|uniref:hypothetical protein n=1 Tax=Vibrio harveyi group TaxID=717610 RepID=UPI0010FFC514|nr:MULTISPECIES: hypothetical protein [Vibrio harveyi group]MCR9831891.1 hypothetical protein [Vibrio parahaemolyticus]MEA5351765.1 hypothetical protein [Vibrio parahaemolyticus]WCP84191.1 hypothetical protein PQE20_27190 [Vibrio harveyi]GEA20346.1 hypothetical protein VH1807_contig00005-0005 [Vibrio harveyi]
MKTKFTHVEVAELPFARRVLYLGSVINKEKLMDEEGKHWHITDVYLPDVVGSLDPRHAGRTWLALFPCADAPYGLERGQRYAQYLHNNPDYYFSEEEKRNWFLCNIDGELYIDDGHHRTVIGRVFLEANGFEPVIKGVLIAYYTGGLIHRIRIFPRRFKHRLISRFNVFKRKIGRRTIS